MTPPESTAKEMASLVVDPIVDMFAHLSKRTLENDQALLELIQALITKVERLEQQVSMLMDLHRVDNDGEETIER